MSTTGASKLVAVLALCGMAASGCGATHELMVKSPQTPHSASPSHNKPAVTLLRIEDASTDRNYQADPNFLGKGAFEVANVFVFPVWSYSGFHGASPRTELVQDAFMAKLQSGGLPIRYQSEGRFEAFTNREDGHLVLSVRLKKFEVDTGFSFILPLVLINAIAFHNIESHVVLECQVRQPGNSTPLWQGTVEGTTKSADDLSKPLEIREANLGSVIQKMIMGAVEQFVQRSNIQQLSLRARNEAYANHVMASQEREATGDWKGAVNHFGKAYDMATTSEQSLAIIQAVAQGVRKQPAKPELPEEARRYGVQATSFVEKKQYEEAINRYAQALAIAPWWAETHFNRALVLSYQDRYAEAITSMKNFLALAPNAPDARAAQDKIYEWELKVK